MNELRFYFKDLVKKKEGEGRKAEGEGKMEK